MSDQLYVSARSMRIGDGGGGAPDASDMAALSAAAPGHHPQSPPVNDDISLCCPSALSCLLGAMVPCAWCCGCLQVTERQELVFLLWGRFFGIMRQPGLYCVNPCGLETVVVSTAIQSVEVTPSKVVDARGNPLRVSGVATYQVVDARKASLDVANWRTYLQTQAEVVLKQICASHPYESHKPGEDSLKREAEKVRREIVQLLQSKTIPAGVRVINFEFSGLSYAPEISAQMLVRQQAEAMLEARKVVVEGAVSIAWDAVQHLKRAGIDFKPEDASRLASNLVVTICSESRVMPTLAL